MADRPGPLKFGIFAQPFHQPGEHPTVACEHDMEVIELLDRLNFDEAWSARTPSRMSSIASSRESARCMVMVSGRMRRSYELFARHVMPRFRGQAQPFEDSLAWAREGHRTLFRPVRAAQRQAFSDGGIEAPEALRPRGRAPEPEGRA